MAAQAAIRKLPEPGDGGHQVSTADQLADALTAALAYPGPALVEVVADPLLV